MESTRQLKINRLIQKELSEIFLMETKQMPGTLITVTTVRTSPDLGVVKAYLSIFPSGKGEELLDNIRKNVKALRFNLGQRFGKHLRIIPELIFYLDDSLDYLENIDRLLDSESNKED